ncbi:hypothetical protein [Methanococcoides methylutens]|uniref:DUF4367 domain-containing protein n=1 Tax=Methanococcoides methylutens MM1 TaxID=1434104 RepID=A0A0E3SS14_METMT|nr:hypothetical protein [Methanococcoides methylutens]AKB85876.1 hypothetical protein MCMEM_1823 [Methanococcoides methylutens MM1]
MSGSHPANLLIISLFLVAAVCISGCMEEKSEQTTTEITDMALQSSDFLQNYTLKEKAVKTENDVSEQTIEKGWKEGYYTIHYNMLNNATNITVIEQHISIFEPGKADDFVRIDLVSNEFATYRELSDPGIGDLSRAYEVSPANEDDVYYILKFSKMNVYEIMYLKGTDKDYISFKEIADIAESKIE